MAHEISIDDVQKVIRLPILDYVVARRVYGKKGDTEVALFRRVIHETVKDIKPTVSDMKKVAEIRMDNLEKRKEKRTRQARDRGETGYVVQLDAQGKCGRGRHASS